MPASRITWLSPTAPANPMISERFDTQPVVDAEDPGAQGPALRARALRVGVRERARVRGAAAALRRAERARVPTRQRVRLGRSPRRPAGRRRQASSPGSPRRLFPEEPFDLRRERVARRDRLDPEVAERPERGLSGRLAAAASSSSSSPSSALGDPSPEAYSRSSSFSSSSRATPRSQRPTAGRGRRCPRRCRGRVHARSTSASAALGFGAGREVVGDRGPQADGAQPGAVRRVVQHADDARGALVARVREPEPLRPRAPSRAEPDHGHRARVRHVGEEAAERHQQVRRAARGSVEDGLGERSASARSAPAR